MITKGIVEQFNKDAPYKVKVRLPIFDSIKGVNNSTSTENLKDAIICTLPYCSNSLNVGDIVLVGFEDNDYGTPIILGHLYKDFPLTTVNNVTGNPDTKTSLNLDLNNLNVGGSVKLSSNISIGNIGYDDLMLLKQLPSIIDKINKLNN